MKAEFWDRKKCAAAAASRWYQQYESHIDDRKGFNWERSVKVYDALVALGPTPDPDEVDRIIGNNGWSRPGSCDGCGKYVDQVVRVGDEPDYDSHTAQLCKMCLIDACDTFMSEGS